jgi:hypothetical protein
MDESGIQAEGSGHRLKAFRLKGFRLKCSDLRPLTFSLNPFSLST